MRRSSEAAKVKGQRAYRRVLGLDSIPMEIKARLMAQSMQLKPVTLRARIDTKVAHLWKIVR